MKFWPSFSLSKEAIWHHKFFHKSLPTKMGLWKYNILYLEKEFPARLGIFGIVVGHFRKIGTYTENKSKIDLTSKQLNWNSKNTYLLFFLYVLELKRALVRDGAISGFRNMIFFLKNNVFWTIASRLDRQMIKYIFSSKKEFAIQKNLYYKIFRFQVPKIYFESVLRNCNKNSYPYTNL